MTAETLGQEKASARGAIMHSVEKGFEILGETGKEATLCLIELRYGLKLNDIPANPEKFGEAVRKMFGIGSSTLLRSVLDELLEERYPLKGEREAVHDFASSLEDYCKSIENGVA